VDAEALRDIVREYALETLGDGDAVLVICRVALNRETDFIFASRLQQLWDDLANANFGPQLRDDLVELNPVSPDRRPSKDFYRVWPSIDDDWDGGEKGRAD